MQRTYAAPLVTDRFAVDLALLVIRLGLASVFMFHGSQKLFSLFGGHGLAGMITTFGPVVGTLVGIGEFFGGVGMLCGLLSRFSGAAHILIMAGAIYNVHWKNGFDMGNHGFEYNTSLIAMAAAILIAGPGRFALARLLPARLKPWFE